MPGTSISISQQDLCFTSIIVCTHEARRQAVGNRGNERRRAGEREVAPENFACGWGETQFIVFQTIKEAPST